MFRLLSTTAVLLGLCVASADAQVTLKRKFPPNTSGKQRVQTQIDQTLTIQGNEVKTSMQNTVTVKATIGEKGPTGLLPITVKMESFQANLTLPNGPVSFDSANPNQGEDNVLTQAFKAMAGSTLVYNVDDSGKAVSVDGTQDILNSTTQEAASLLKSDLKAENLANEFNQETKQLPDKPVVKGDKWTRVKKSQIGGGQSLTFDIEYSYEGTVEKNGKTLDRITSVAKSVQYAQEADAPGGARVTESDLKVSEWSGTIMFDREAGEIVSTEQTSKIVGSLTLQANNMNFPSTLDLTISQSVESEE